MKAHFPTRFWLGAALAAWLAAAPAFARGQQFQPRLRQAQWAARPLPNGRVLLAQSRLIGPRLQQWMEQHRNLPPAQQERALENDPSFRALNSQQQQGALNQLRQLQGMTPEKRNLRWAWLGMTPQQRQQVEALTQQWEALPPARQVLMQQALTALRRVPPPQRPAAMATYPPLRQLSPYERQLLANWLFWEPFLNPAAPNGSLSPGPSQGP
jgi:hypothetical protein